MKVIEVQPVTFTTGEILGPDDLNEIFLAAKDAVADVGERRFAKGDVTLQFVHAMNSPYLHTDALAARTYRFKCPVDCVLERAFLDANMVSSAEVTVSIVEAGTSTAPDGATAPLLTTGGAVASADDDTTDVNVDAVHLEADQEYEIKVESTGTFTLYRFDVQLIVRTDRWVSGGSLAAPAFSPTLVRDSSSDAAATVTANTAALDTEVDKFPANGTAPLPALYQVHGLASATDADLCKFAIPQFDEDRAESWIFKVYLWGVLASAGAGGTLSCILRDESGSAVLTVSVSTTGQTEVSAESADIHIALTDAAADPSDPADDFTIEFSSSDSVDITKAYALVWVTRV